VEPDCGDDAAPAKVNLYLDILARRADGYHEIETVFVPLPEPADRVRVSAADADGIHLTCSAPELSADRRNLAWRAAEVFAESAKRPPRWRIAIEKRIPVSAGLGGGSSDAAAVLRALNRLHGDPLDREALHAAARSLGADVPFFLDPRPSLAHGIGEILSPIACPVIPALVIVNPGFPLSTRWAYGHCRPGQAPGRLEALLAALAAADLDGLCANAWNGFEDVAFWKFPVLELVIEFLHVCGCRAAHLCGSGPTLYGVCVSKEQAEHAAREAVERFGPRFRAWACAQTGGWQG